MMCLCTLIAAPEDFLPTTELATLIVTFVSNQQQLCHNISILHDLSPEGVESFTVHLNDSDPDVVLDPSSATVFIFDLVSEHLTITASLLYHCFSYDQVFSID